jgi:hypothetical protein
MVKKLDLLESNHASGLDCGSRELDLSACARGEFIKSRGNRASVTARESASASDTRQSLSATQVRQNLAGGFVTPRASGVRSKYSNVAETVGDVLTRRTALGSVTRQIWNV